MRAHLLRASVSLLLVACGLAAPVHASAQTRADSTAITAAALDYIDGYYSGNAERMERAVHPELAKRIIRTNPDNNRSALSQMSA